jgi:xylan 1,4-beta-xylosidase
VKGQTTPGHVIWSGTGGEYPEGPHIYKINGKYYLMIAEGGTGYEHRETIARSDSPWGPYLPYENNPILSHRDIKYDPIGCTGHADLVQLQDGSWWAVFLGVRQKNANSQLGRESFLAPVEWTENGWPIIGEMRRAKLDSPGPALPRHPLPPKPVRDDFAAGPLGLEWNYVRNPDCTCYFLSDRPGWLSLKGAAATLDDHASPTALLRRQRHFDAQFATFMDFTPSRNGEEAGIVLRQTDSLHAEFCVLMKDGKRHLVLKLTEPARKTVIYDGKAPDAPIQLSVTADRDKYTFAYRAEDGPAVEAGNISTETLSVEASWNQGSMCFTGMMIGLYATGNGAGSSVPACFDWFDCKPLDNAK